MKKCPRFNGFGDGVCTWHEDNTCSYCGSLHPDEFLARLRARDAEAIPTDKNYKVYIRNIDGAQFKQTFRDCYNQTKIGDPKCEGPDTCTHWVTREISQTKFYFPHFSTEQMLEFIDLYNARGMKIAYPGHFYVWPYFMRAVSADLVIRA